MGRVFTVIIILLMIVSVNGLWAYISLQNAVDDSENLNVSIINNETRLRTSAGNAAGEGGGGSPFSLYPLNLRDIDTLIAVYKPDKFPASYKTILKKQFTNFSFELLGRLAACYGTLYYYLENQGTVPDYLTHENEYFIDISETLLNEYMNYTTVRNIMYAAYNETGETFEGWLWNDFFESKDFNTWWEFNGSNTMNFIQNSSGETDEVNRLYCSLMECNLYEAMLAKKITLYPATREELALRIAELNEEYMANTEYIGFSERDADIISDYILKYVIGISNKNGIAVFRLIKKLVEAQIVEAVSEERNRQLAEEGFTVKNILKFIEYAPTTEIKAIKYFDADLYKLKFVVINSKLTREFNALPILSNYRYNTYIVDEETLKSPMIQEKYYYNKWYYISPQFKVSPLTVNNIQSYYNRELMPECDCIILKVSQNDFQLYADI